ncbi:MAG: gamma-glutamyltransferase [Dehalococcoidia bacterium]
MDTTPFVAVRGDHGAAATPHYLATQAAMACLMDGGNAVDAAVTANAVLGVVEPAACGLGGDLFMLLHEGASGRILALNGSGRAGGAMTAETYRAQGLEAMPQRGALSVTVPGAVDAWDVALTRAGTRGLDEVLQPAIRYAEEGFAAGRFLTSNIERSASVLTPEAHARYLPGGRVPRRGERFRQPELAATLRLLAAGGRDAFYRGDLADRIAGAVQQAGGLLTAEDFAEQPPAEWVEPVRGAYRGREVVQAPPNSHGIATLLMLNILEGYEFSATEMSAQDVHLMVEAKHAAFVERDRWVADPATMSEPAPLGRLLSPAWADEARAAIDPTRARVAAGSAGGGDTVYLAVVDRDGNAVSLVESLYWIFGSGMVAGDTGVVLHNRAGGFTLDASHPNALAPGKRPFHTLAPAMLLEDGALSLLFGTRGAHGQPQTHVQLLHRLLDQRMGLAEALAAPRWISGSVDGQDTRTLRVESRFGDDVIDALRGLGHSVEAGAPWDDATGHTNAISIDHEQGFMTAATDPRSDGAAQAW